MSFLHDITAERLVERAVRNARPRSVGRGTEVRWSAVADAFGLGSTYATELCKKFGLNPDDQIDCPTCERCEQAYLEENPEARGEDLSDLDSPGR